MENVVELLITIASLGAMMWGMMKFMLRDIRNDIAILRNDVKDLKDATNRSETRIDHLYEICIDMLGKDKKK